MSDPTNGSAASGIGLAIMTGLEKVWRLWEYVNSTRDMLANHIVSGSHRADQITSGTFDPARIPALVEAQVPRTLPGTLNIGNLAIGGTGQGFDPSGNLYANNGTFAGPLISPWARGNGISGGLSIYVRSDGVIGIAASSRRFKKNIRAASIDVQAVLALRVVQFRYKAAIDPSGDLQVGLIAEELDALGLTWLVAYDDDGQPVTVHYERLALALVPVAQDHESRIAALEQKIGDR